MCLECAYRETRAAALCEWIRAHPRVENKYIYTQGQLAPKDKDVSNVQCLNCTF